MTTQFQKVVTSVEAAGGGSGGDAGTEEGNDPNAGATVRGGDLPPGSGAFRPGAGVGSRTAAPSAELLDLILSVVPDAAVVVDEHGQVVATNANAETLFGYPSGTMVGLPVEALVPERLRDRHRAHRDEYAAAATPRAMGSDLQLFGRCYDGSEIPIDVSLAPVAGTDRLLVVAAMRDVSDRLTAAADQAQLAAVVQSSTDGVMTIGDDGSVRTWNPGAADMFGYEPSAVVGRHISMLVPEEESTCFEEQMARAAAGKPGPASDARWRTATGDMLDVAVSVSRLLCPDGRAGGFSVIVRDITERKAMESALHWRERWLESTAEVRLALLSGATLAESLALVADHLHAALGTITAVLALDADTNWDELGTDAPATNGGPVIALPGHVLRDLVHDEELLVHPTLANAPLTPDLAAALRLGPVGTGPSCAVVAASLAGRGPTTGLLVVATAEGPPSADALLLIQGLAEQLALAVRMAQARAHEAHVLLASDRARIARDLHDHVIQSLFATGMRLQASLPLVTDDQVAEAINSSIDELDSTIGQIRTSIFSLQATHQKEPASLRSEVLHIVSAASSQLGFDPEVRFAGPVESLPARIRPHLLAVTREALSNVARHASATTTVVELRAEQDNAVLVVADDGTGIGLVTRRSGLANARARAQELGGDMELHAPPAGGTELRWWVPTVDQHMEPAFG